MTLLQYKVNIDLLDAHGRLNPHDVPLEKAGDCGANTLFLLGIMERLDAIELSRRQNICWINKEGNAYMLDYLSDTYLFTDPTKQFATKRCTQDQLMYEVQVLNGGYGTFLFMKGKGSKLGHFVCIYKNEETLEIEIADLQTEDHIYNNSYEPRRVEEYLSQYESFYIPVVLDATSPVRHSQTKGIHGSPAKTIPLGEASERPLSPKVRRQTSERTPEKTHNPIGYASEYPESSPELKRSEYSLSNENLNAYRRHPYATEGPVRSPLSPLPQKRNRIGGTRRKRRTRRKN